MPTTQTFSTGSLIHWNREGPGSGFGKRKSPGKASAQLAKDIRGDDHSSGERRTTAEASFSNALRNVAGPGYQRLKS